MAIEFSNAFGCVVLLAILIAPGAIAAYISGNSNWLWISPIAVSALLLLIAALPIKRKITPQEFAVELEQCLNGTAGGWGWDDTLSPRIADQQLDQLRIRLLERLGTTDWRPEQVAAMVEQLKRGEIPDSWD
jgi:hypothetical protein